jgi:5-methyltetrahydrofolate--homocysteine methyltransferase
MNFATLLEQEKIVLFDGAIGTQLDKHGLMGRGRCNLDAPQIVLEIHKEYVNSGCQAITTNTLTMNRIYIETHNVSVSVQEVNRAGVELAKQAAGDALCVLADISSTGQLLEPYGTYKESAFYDAFKEQAGILAKAGVDGFIVETMIDLREAVCAVRACKENFKLPVIASIAFFTETRGARTVMGNSAQDCVKFLSEAGADVIGANCGSIDPQQMAEIVSMFRTMTDLPIVAQPNAGKPILIEDKTVFDMSPEAFAEGIERCINAGARFVGGCCGTTPSHIRKIAELLKEKM